MDILSYRGPGAPGGVSSGLARLWAEQKTAGGNNWWFMNDTTVQELGASDEPLAIAHLDERLIQGHYRYCNDFLWPMMHDLPQYATFNPIDQLHYNRFNERMARVAQMRAHEGQPLFVQDYQFALIPRMARQDSLVFWHIPWPANVLPQHVSAIREIAFGLLHAKTVGFHTHEYAQNFLNFVHTHIAQCSVDYAEGKIFRHPAVGRGASLKQASGSPLSIYSNSTMPVEVFEQQTVVSRVISHPLGIDMDFWANLVAAGKKEVLSALNLGSSPFILSVDRADYTKGVANRLAAIDLFFERNPAKLGALSFVQVCGRSRPGLSAFDNYWEECRTVAQQVNEKWQQGEWKPIRWQEEPLKPPQLSRLYDAAAAMLVNPVRDGLNLTAKEYVACQNDTAGVLMLSTRAGVWTELNEHALPIDPYDRLSIASSVENALRLSPLERERRMRGMKRTVRANSLRTWWEVMTDSEQVAAHTAVRRSA